MEIAVVGTGVAGLVAARSLHRAHRVTVFEAADRPGGHAWTVDVPLDGTTYPVDVGFMVYNEVTYPVLTGLFRDLGVETRETDMSFSVRCPTSRLEWCGTDLSAVFAWKRNAMRPAFLRMLADVLRFNREAPSDLDAGIPEPTLGAYLDARGYSAAFRDWYLLPMGAAIWSSPARSMLDVPAEFLIRFFRNHGLLQVDGHLQWRTVVGGARSYVDALVAPFRDRVRTRTPVRQVRRVDGGIDVATDGGTERFDHVVLACHADQALALLADPSEAERQVLAAIPYHRSRAVLHTDLALLPRRNRARASWNVHRTGSDALGVGVTYDLSRLQGHPSSTPILLTLNRTENVDPARTIRSFEFEHPAFTAAGERAKVRHGEIDGVRGVSYCGAYWRNGFHEDGAWSALRAARPLLASGALRTVA